MLTSSIEITVSTKIAWYVKAWMFAVTKMPARVLAMLGEKFVWSVTMFLVDKGVTVEAKA